MGCGGGFDKAKNYANKHSVNNLYFYTFECAVDVIKNQANKAEIFTTSDKYSKLKDYNNNLSKY